MVSEDMSWEDMSSRIHFEPPIESRERPNESNLLPANLLVEIYIHSGSLLCSLVAFVSNSFIYCVRTGIRVILGRL